MAARSAKKSATKGRHRKPRTAPSGAAQWLRVGAVGVGLGAAIAVGQGTATAAPDDSSQNATHASGAQGSHADAKRGQSSTAERRRSTAPTAASGADNAGPDRGSRTIRPSTPTQTTPSKPPSALRPARNAPLISRDTPTPAALLNAAATPAAMVATRINTEVTAVRTVAATADHLVGGVPSWIHLGRLPHRLPLPATPIGPLFAALAGAVRDVELAMDRRHATNRPVVATLKTGQVPSATVDSGERTPAVASSAQDQSAETERERSQAELNKSLGWVPVLGTAFNAFNFVADFVDFARAALRGDTADMSDEINDMTVDLVGMIPVLGGPLAAMIHQTLVTDPVVGHAPTPVGDIFGTDEDTSLAGNVLSNDTDADGDVLTAALNKQAAHGAVTLNADGTFTYTPVADYNGVDTFTYTVSDGANSKTGTVSITVAPVNDTPIATDDTATVTEDTPTVIAVLGNDIDADRDPLSILNASTPGHGTVTIGANNTITYTPTANYNGADTFVYTVSDGHGSTDIATVSVTITPVNDAPVAGADNFTTNEDNALTDNVLTNDTDAEGDPLTAALNAGPSHGTITLNGDGTFTYTPTADYNGTDGFTYAVSDGVKSKTGTVSITINPINDAPIAGDDAATLTEDTPTVIAVLGNDTDADNDPLSVTDASTPGHGTVSIGADGAITYTPTANYNGTDGFTYTVTDGHGANTTATVSVTITPVNDPPVAGPDDLTTDEDTPLTGNVLSNATDADNDPLTAALGTGPNHGELTLNGDGTFTYNPTANYNGADGFTYTVSDGATTNTATVTITINPVNDAPVAVDGTANLDEDTSTVITVVDKATDVESDPLSVSGTTNGAHGTVSVGEDGTLTYTPTANYNGADSFTYTISDGNGGTTTATISVTVNPVNDAPVAVGENYGVDQDHQLTGNVRDNDYDPDGELLTVGLVSGPGHGSLTTLNPDGSFAYTPAGGYSGTDSFTYSITDPNGATTTTTANITVNYVAPPPPPPPPPPPSNGRKTGSKRNYNAGAGGNCTWGAYQKWYEATGYYPALTGNAADWDTSARNTGWTVVLDAEPRSIVVFERGVAGADATNGHVGWVVSVEQRSNGRYVTVVEMNGWSGYGGGFGKWDTHVYKDVPGMSYILAP